MDEIKKKRGWNLAIERAKNDYSRVGGVKKDRCFKVYLRMPDGVSEEEIMAYITDAVRGWKGGLSPEEPLFMLDRNRIKVTRKTPKMG